MAVTYGTDFLLLTGLDPLFRTVSGPRLVLAGVMRRWTVGEDTTAGARIYRGRCRDLRRLLASRYDQALLVAWALDLASVAKEDERVTDCAVVIETSREGRALRLRGEVQPADGSEPFKFVMPFDTFKPELI